MSNKVGRPAKPSAVTCHWSHGVCTLLREAEVRLAQGRRVGEIRRSLGISEWRACRVVGQHRSTPRKAVVVREDEESLTFSLRRWTTNWGQANVRLLERPQT